MSSLASAPRDRWLPDGTQNGAGSTPSHDEAIRRTGANVVANSYASPRTAYASGMHASASQNPSPHGWPAQHMGQTLDFGQMALTPTRAMHGYNNPSFVPSTPTPLHRPNHNIGTLKVARSFTRKTCPSTQVSEFSALQVT